MLSFVQTIVLAVIVVLLITIVWTHIGDARRNFSGLWAGSPEFNSASGLDDMLLWVGPGSPAGIMAPFGGTQYKGYLFMVNSSEDVVCSQPVEIWANFGHSFWRQDTYKCDATLVFPDASDADTPPWPGKTSLVLDAKNGELKVHDSSQLLAEMRKIHVGEVDLE